MVVKTAKSQMDSFFQKGNFFWLLDRAPDMPIRYLGIGSVRMKHLAPIRTTEDIVTAIKASIADISQKFGQEPNQQDECYRVLMLENYGSTGLRTIHVCQFPSPEDEPVSRTSSCGDFLEKFVICYPYAELSRKDQQQPGPHADAELTTPEPEEAGIGVIKIEEDVGVFVSQLAAVPDAVSTGSGTGGTLDQNIPPVPAMPDVNAVEQLSVAPKVPEDGTGGLASSSASWQRATTSSSSSRSSAESGTTDSTAIDGKSVAGPPVPPPPSPPSMETPAVPAESPINARGEPAQSPAIGGDESPNKKSKMHHHSPSLFDQSVENRSTSTPPEAKPGRRRTKSRNRDPFAAKHLTDGLTEYFTPDEPGRFRSAKGISPRNASPPAESVVVVKQGPDTRKRTVTVALQPKRKLELSLC